MWSWAGSESLYVLGYDVMIPWNYSGEKVGMDKEKRTIELELNRTGMRSVKSNALRNPTTRIGSCVSDVTP